MAAAAVTAPVFTVNGSGGTTAASAGGAPTPTPSPAPAPGSAVMSQPSQPALNGTGTGTGTGSAGAVSASIAKRQSDAGPPRRMLQPSASEQKRTLTNISALALPASSNAAKPTPTTPTANGSGGATATAPQTDQKHSAAAGAAPAPDRTMTAIVDNDWVLTRSPDPIADANDMRVDRILKVESVHLRSVWLKDWNIRWLVLKRDALLYFKNAAPITREPPRGRIPVSDIASVKPDPLLPLTFQVNTKSAARHYLFRCYSASEVSAWTTALTAILTGKYEAWEAEQRAAAKRIRDERAAAELAVAVTREQARVKRKEEAEAKRAAAAEAAASITDNKSNSSAAATAITVITPVTTSGAAAFDSVASVTDSKQPIKPDAAASGEDLVERLLHGLNSAAVNITPSAAATATATGADHTKQAPSANSKYKAVASSVDFTPASLNTVPIDLTPPSLPASNSAVPPAPVPVAAVSTAAIITST